MAGDQVSGEADVTKYDGDDEAALDAMADEAAADYDSYGSAGSGSGPAGGGSAVGGGPAGGGGGGGGGGGEPGGGEPGGGEPGGGRRGPSVTGPTSGRKPTELVIKGRIEWNGTVVRWNDGIREVNFDQLTPADVAKLHDAAGRAARTRARANKAGSSFRAKSPRAQARELTRRRGGKEALAALTGVSVGTVTRWLSGKQAPSKARSEQIGRAYGELGKHAKKVAEARTFPKMLDSVLRERYGVAVRIFDPEFIHFQ
jgi:transcriptional regulator with XRE-family HTH domain